MARVNEGSHKFTCHPHGHPQNGTRRSQHSQECIDPRRYSFCDSWSWSLASWLQNKRIFRTHRRTWRAYVKFGDPASVFTAGRYNSAVYGVIGVLLRRLNLGSREQCRTIAQGLWFADAKDVDKIPTESSPNGAPNRGGVSSDRRFSTNISLYSRNGAR